LTREFWRGYHRLPVAKHSHSILELARTGATHRLRELTAEIAQLVKVFPHLRYGSAVSPAMPDAVEEPKTPRRRTMSAAARKKISEAQKARWAKQKLKKG
jgi:hypothetical protein